MLEFTPWRRFRAERDRSVTRKFLLGVAQRSKEAFESGIASSKSGRVYRKKGGRLHRASAPGEYPASDSGRLLRSIRTRVTADESTIGTSVRYAKWLRDGTRRMARRRMSDDALKEGAENARSLLKGWVRWKRG